jgi:hypothetical protein
MIEGVRVIFHSFNGEKRDIERRNGNTGTEARHIILRHIETRHIVLRHIMRRKSGHDGNCTRFRPVTLFLYQNPDL